MESPLEAGGRHVGMAGSVLSTSLQDITVLGGYEYRTVLSFFFISVCLADPGLLVCFGPLGLLISQY